MVLIFIGIVLVSLFTAYLMSAWLFQSRIHTFIHDDLLKDGQRIIQAYQTTPSAKLVPFIQNYSGYSGRLVQLYNQDGRPLLSAREPISVDRSRVQEVLEGKYSRTFDAGLHQIPMMGIPFQSNGQAYALFITLQENRVEEEFMNSIHLLYILVLFIGSFLILIAARYVVNPILRLTEATKAMTKGNFEFVGTPTTRRDEIGQLSLSFFEMANELSKLNQMRQDFVSSVSHEIQSPLTSISGFTKALKQKKMTEESRMRYLTIIEEESERLSRLGQNLLRLSFLQQKQQPLEVSAFRLDEQLRRIVIALEPLWSEKEMNLEVELESMVIRADQDQLDQVWINLVSNAIKFTPVEGSIRITALKKDDRIIVTIADNGIGILEEELADIFKPFHKADKARNRAVKGNGLGLSIVKQILVLHHGDIHVSSSPYTGTTFTVTLPT
ncbi:MAG: two-component system sensor histidine kinase [Brevibacillus sp.]|nr:two-component system sensor histidine kinase [Brevibacillus sp.]